MRHDLALDLAASHPQTFVRAMRRWALGNQRGDVEGRKMLISDSLNCTSASRTNQIGSYNRHSVPIVPELV